MRALFEPLSGLVKVLKNGCVIFEYFSGLVRVLKKERSYTEPFEWAAAVRFIDSETVELHGVTEKITLSEWKAVLKCFGDLGVKTVTYKRYRGGELRIRRWQTSRVT